MAQPKGYAAFILFPHLKMVSHGPTRFRIDYYGDARQQNDDFMHVLGSHIAKADKATINWNAINLLKDDTKRLDLRHLSFEFDSSEFGDEVDRFLRAVVTEHDGTRWIGLSDPPEREDRGPIS